MTDRHLRAIGKVILAKSGQEMVALAERYRLLTPDGKIDLSGPAVRFVHSNLDLSIFAFGRTDFLNSRLISCSAEGVDFSSCRFVNAYIASEGTKKTSFRGTRFDHAFMEGNLLRPAELAFVADATDLEVPGELERRYFVRHRTQ